MTDDVTQRHALPLIVTGQAQKDVTHNEALTLIDLLVNAQVEEVALDTPPAAPQPGQCWVVGQVPVGEWQGQAGALAGWTAAGWRFVAPRDGMRARHRASGEEVVRADGMWRRGVVSAAQVLVGGKQVLGSRAATIPAPGGGATIDAEARAGVVAIVSALRHHGLID